MADNYTWASMPMITCVYCDREFVQDDYYHLTDGDIVTCPYCEKEMLIDEINTIIEARLVKNEPKE